MAEQLALDVYASRLAQKMKVIISGVINKIERIEITSNIYD